MIGAKSGGANVVNAVCLVFLLHQKSVFASGRFEQFLNMFESHGEVVSTIYLSGNVLEAMPLETQTRLKQVLLSNKLELLTGAMFEPLLPLIPSVDAGYQVRQHLNLLEKCFGTSARGIWLQDCAWESHLASILIAAGCEFTFLSISQLERAAGLWITEDQGKTLRIFGFGQQLSFSDYLTISVSEQLEKIKTTPGVQTLILELHDSDECFVWVESLMAGLAVGKPKTMLCSQILDTQKPQALIYPKPSWNRKEPWRDMLSNPEINWLHKRTNRASAKLNAQFRVPEEAYRHLYQAQKASLVEHPELHAAAYQSIIRSENILEPHKYAWLEIELLDLDCDGSDEIVAEAHTMNLYFKPSDGGRLLEFDDRGRSINLVLKALSDHFIGAEESLQRFQAGQTLELGDFREHPFEGSKYRDRVTMNRLGVVRGPSGVPVSVEVKKAIRILPKESKLEIEYRLTNHGDWDIVTRFGSAWELELHDSDATLMVNGQTVPLSSPNLEHRMTQSLGLHQASLGLEFKFLLGRENLVWSIEKPNSIMILPLWDLDLPKGRSRRIHFEVQLIEI